MSEELGKFKQGDRGKGRKVPQSEWPVWTKRPQAYDGRRELVPVPVKPRTDEKRKVRKAENNDNS